MNDMNRLLIFLLLAGLLYALYKYQHIIFGNNILHSNITPTKIPINEPQQIKYKQISADNISQLSLDSLENENGESGIYKPESFLGSLDNCSINLTDNSSNNFG
jgi:hypothetical protein